MSDQKQYYSISRASNILKVKRRQLLFVESCLPQLQTCGLRPRAKHYTPEDFSLLQLITRRMHIQKISLEESVDLYISELYGDQHIQKDADDFPVIKPDSDRKQCELTTTEVSHTDTKSSKTMRKSVKDIEHERGADEPDSWYYNKLFAESQGQKSFGFDDPSQSYDIPPSLKDTTSDSEESQLQHESAEHGRIIPQENSDKSTIDQDAKHPSWQYLYLKGTGNKTMSEKLSHIEQILDKQQVRLAPDDDSCV